LTDEIANICLLGVNARFSLLTGISITTSEYFAQS